jgi:hypothetical protein
MSIVSLKVENRLDEFSNFLPWKARLTLLMKEQDLWDIVTSSNTSTEYSVGNTTAAASSGSGSTGIVGEERHKGLEGDPRSYQRSYDSTCGVIAQSVDWEKPNPIHGSVTTMGVPTHCHLR